MPEPWIQVGASVLLATGPFAGLGGTLQAIDLSADTILVQLEIFRRPISLTFPFSSAEQHLKPLADQPAVWVCPHAEVHKADLLSACPQADATYRTRCGWFSTLALVQIIRTGSDHQLVVRSLNLTSPVQQKSAWGLCEIPLTASQWADFARLAEACGFWQLPHDDGKRVAQRARLRHWSLEGYQEGRYHRVVRQTGQPTSELSACCAYLQGLAEQGRSPDV